MGQCFASEHTGSKRVFTCAELNIPAGHTDNTPNGQTHSPGNGNDQRPQRVQSGRCCEEKSPSQETLPGATPQGRFRADQPRSLPLCARRTPATLLLLLSGLVLLSQAVNS